MFDITVLCRGCMKDNVSLVNLYETVQVEEDSLQLAELLVQCTPAEVSKEDGLPQNLCDDCVKVLQVAYTFRSQVIKSQEELKKILQTNIKTEPLDVSLKTEDNVPDYFDTFDDFNFDHDISKTELESIIYTCNKCSKQFTKHNKYLKHLAAHENLSLECSICRKLFGNQALLDKHKAKHEKTMCLICNKYFEKETKLLEHMVEHTEGFDIKLEGEVRVNMLRCNECNITFTKARSLASHMKKHKNKDKQTEFVCDNCGKTFLKKCILKRHLSMHEKKHKCDECPKSFGRRDQLVAHTYSHKDKKPYVCSYCKKGQMTSHLTTHTDAHPYKCAECGATFTKQNSLKKHSLIHLAVRPFACETCNMRFTCKDHLKRHNRIHTGEKPYKCNYCERAFSQSNDLVKHTRQHVGQNIYQCTICSARFRLVSELKHHYPVHFANGKSEEEENNPKSDPKDPTTTPADDKFSKELSLLEMKAQTDFNGLMDFKDEKELPQLKPQELPILTLKPPENKDDNNVIDSNKIVITINEDTNGIVNGITIKLPKES
ncbi:hypothetical protein HW555_003581 [Spodoptera exigua]|uniref:Zinc finger protein n=1 Tax=Spodoptera exigua TaxID=7107 RepID=A0A835L6Z1_SPOEX|nr:hypothetical protein HW555_003581 [Spodoptera exigua]